MKKPIKIKMGRKTIILKVRSTGKGSLAVFDPKEPAKFFTF